MICWRSHRQWVPELDLSIWMSDPALSLPRFCPFHSHDSQKLTEKEPLERWDSKRSQHTFLPNSSSHQGWEPKRAGASERSHSKLLMENGASTPPAEFTLLNSAWLSVGVGQDMVSRGQVCAAYAVS